MYRSFLTRAYPTMKRHNPHTPILIREALGVEPKVWARYGMVYHLGPPLARRCCESTRKEADARAEYGREKMQPLTGLDAKGIEGKVAELAQGKTEAAVGAS